MLFFQTTPSQDDSECAKYKLPRVLAILFLSLAVEKQTLVEEHQFMPSGILNICHPRASEGFSFVKTLAQVFSNFYSDSCLRK